MFPTAGVARCCILLQVAAASFVSAAAPAAEAEAEAAEEDGRA